MVATYGIDPGLKRLLQSAGQTQPADQPILESSAGHPIILKMKAEQDEQSLADRSHMLFEQAVLSSGERLEDPVNFVHRLNHLLTHLSH